MSDYAVPEYILAVARRVDCVAFRIKTGTPPHQLAQEMRDLALIMERKI